MAGLDYTTANVLLNKTFEDAELLAIVGETNDIDPALEPHLATLFTSRTQAYREALVGCALARLCDPSIDVTKPYIKHGENAYNGRTLDERVVNPTLQSRRIPSSGGPFLSALRRGVRFDEGMRRGIRDHAALDAFLFLVTYINEANDGHIEALLLALTLRFVELRNASEVPIARLNRISHEQYAALIKGLLATRSGGRFPVLLVEATFLAIRETFGLDWTVIVQGINVADGASGAGGDIEIRRGEQIVLAAEVTERPVSGHRVQTTFNMKIAPNGIEDYLFFVTTEPEPDAIDQARQYFSYGHEVNFVDLPGWILITLVSIGNAGRNLFNRVLTERIDGNIPATLKVAWNDQIARITAIEAPRQPQAAEERAPYDPKRPT